MLLIKMEDKVNRLKKIINERKNLSFLIGNGINRYKNEENDENRVDSWYNLLDKLWKKYGSKKYKFPNGMDLTELYDIIKIKNNKKNNKNLDIEITAELEKKLQIWNYSEHHKKIVEFAIAKKTPIFTTNYDQLLMKASDLKLFGNKRNNDFTHYYPWKCYYAKNEIKDPLKEFGLWHIHGMIRYKRSIRLGITHYMGMVNYAKKYLRIKTEKNYYEQIDQRKWNGVNSWLEVFLKKDLFIFGLGLDRSEIFLRWLLFERKKFRDYLNFKNKDIFIEVKESKKDDKCEEKMFKAELEQKKFYFENLGFEYIVLDKYEDLYKNLWD